MDRKSKKKCHSFTQIAIVATKRTLGAIGARPQLIPVSPSAFDLRMRQGYPVSRVVVRKGRGERRALDKQIRAARVDVVKIEREYGAAAVDNTEQHRPTICGFKVAYDKLGKQLRVARDQLPRLIDKRGSVPQRVAILDFSDRTVVKLATERKHLTDLIEMVAYRAKSGLLTFLRPHYTRADHKGGTLLRERFAAIGDIRVTHNELQITVAPPNSPHRTRAAQALCQLLDQTATIFPGSNLRLGFAVRPPLYIGQ